MAFYGLFYALTNPVLKALVGGKRERKTCAAGRSESFSFLTSVTTLLSSVITGALWKSLWSGGAVLFFGGNCGRVTEFALLAHRAPKRE